MEKENWINDILDSADARQHAIPDVRLFSKIEIKIRSNSYVSTKTVWLAAASVVILAAVNIAVLRKSTAGNKLTAIATMAQSFDQSNQLYK